MQKRIRRGDGGLDPEQASIRLARCFTVQSSGKTRVPPVDDTDLIVIYNRHQEDQLNFVLAQIGWVEVF